MKIDWTTIDAVLFDLDGVLTPTAKVHEAAWKRSFDDFLADRIGPGFDPFDESAYLAYVDGKPRYDGVRSFLASRGIVLPEGAPSDPAGYDTVCALGNLKNDMFNRVLAEDGVEPYPDAMALLGTGLCGGLTTYSAFAVQTHGLGRRFGAVYAVATIGLALAACALGFWVTA